MLFDNLQIAVYNLTVYKHICISRKLKDVKNLTEKYKDVNYCKLGPIRRNCVELSDSNGRDFTTIHAV